MTQLTQDITFHDLEPEREVFFRDICEGLSKEQKTLPCKYFYDETGSGLFNAICTTNEYYPTRTELSIMRTYAKQMADLMGENCLLIEYGSGNGEKIRLILNHLNNPSGYVPIDISKEHLKQTALDLNCDYPHLEVLAVCADFTKEFKIPDPQNKVNKNVVYFPGSTIGNFNQNEAVRLLESMNTFLNKGDGLLIGVDLKKEESILTRAYNDQAGFTKAFNRNILSRINNELDGNFKLDWFDHQALYNDELGRMEMHLVSQKDHDAKVNDQTFNFRRGESIHTESSYKYTIDEFAQLAHLADFKLEEYWTDKNQLFGVLYLTRNRFH